MPEKDDENKKESVEEVKNDATPIIPPESIMMEIPGARVKTELDVARAMAFDRLESPQIFHNVTLFDIRITGTGAAFRQSIDEFVYRNPDNYLTDEFLQRCNGLPVIWMHPKDVLNSDEFEKRIIGTIFLPYIDHEGKNVNGIAKIYDEKAIKFMIQSKIDGTPISTSPGVMFNKSSDNREIELADGKNLLIEGKPVLVDHIAICECGVWDKLGAPTGVRLDSQTEEDKMPKEDNNNKEVEQKEAKNDSDPQAINATILDALNKMGSRFDAMEKRLDSMEKPKEPEEKKEEKTEVKDDAEKVETQRRLDAVEALLKNDEDETEVAAMSDAQAKNDAVMQLFGKQAPQPLRGEKLQAYRLRLLKPLQQYSTLKDVNLSVINDAAAFNHLEKQIYNDAQAAAAKPETFVQAGFNGLIEVNKRVGRVDRTEFIGNIQAFTGSFKQPAFRGKVNRNPGH